MDSELIAHFPLAEHTENIEDIINVTGLKRKLSFLSKMLLSKAKKHIEQTKPDVFLKQIQPSNPLFM